MTIPQKPTCQELLDDNYSYESISRELDDSWRHGNYVTEVFHRKSDNTYWQAFYKVSGDGEYNGLREDEGDIYQVVPHEEVVKLLYGKLCNEHSTAN